MIWSWLFRGRADNAKPPVVKSSVAKSASDKAKTQSKRVDLPRAVRPLDGSPVTPIVVPDPIPAPADTNAAAAAAVAGAAFLYGAEMLMQGSTLGDAGQAPGAGNSAAAPGPADQGPGNAGG